jgi:hypothetical protein
MLKSLELALPKAALTMGSWVCLTQPLSLSIGSSHKLQKKRLKNPKLWVNAHNAVPQVFTRMG